MPIFRDNFARCAPRYRYKPCPSCGSELGVSTKQCCLDAQVERAKNRKVKKTTFIEPLVFCNDKERGKYQLLPTKRKKQEATV